MAILNIYSAVRPMDLMGKATQLLETAATPDHPLQPRWVIQPGRLWERDLRRRLADRGIAASLMFGSLRLTLERAFGLVCPDARLMTEDQLFWSVLGLLEKHKGDLGSIGLKDSSAPRLWLAVNTRNPSLARIQLARLLTGILDDHATHRPEAVLQWLGGTIKEEGDTQWIAELAKALWSGSGCPRPLALQLPVFIEKLQQRHGVWPGFPSRVIAVVSGAQPGIYLHALGALSLACPVHLLMLETCERGLSDQLITWRDVRNRWKTSGSHKTLPEFVRDEKWLVAGTLQAFWGEAGITLQQQVVDLEESLAPLGIDLSESRTGAGESDNGSILAVLQGDVRQTREPRASKERLPVNINDHSLSLIDATSPLRELEGARDAMRAALQRDMTLQPSDILMVLADTARYAPLLPAVFGTTEPGKTDSGLDGLPRIPWHLADRSLRTDSDIMAALQELLAALGARLSLPVLSDLLAQPAIQSKLDFSLTETAELVEYLKDAGFRWGLNKDDRKDGQPGETDGMWTLDFALRRLVAGFTHPDAMIDPVGSGAGVTPLPAFEGLASAKLVRFIKWANTLESARAEFCLEHRLGLSVIEEGTWLGWLHTWAPQLIELGGEREGQSVWLSRVTRLLAEGVRYVNPEARFSAEAFVALFAEAATSVEETLPLGKGIGGMTVASSRMARILPAKMMVVVGLSDGAWPKQESMRPRGLLREASPGDRRRREEDRLATLEWVLSAERVLVWTWQGRSEQNGRDVPPSVVVGELLDVCRATFQENGKALIRKLHMHGFDPGEFLGASESYDVIASKAAVALLDTRGNPARTGSIRWKALPLDPERWGLPGIMGFALTGATPAGWGKAQWIQLSTKLVSFFKLPCREFLKTIEVHSGGEYEMLPDRESLTLEGLEAWGIRDELLQFLVATESVDPAMIQKRLACAGKLPPGASGETVFRKILEEVKNSMEKARKVAGPDNELIPLRAMNWDAGPCLIRVCASDSKAIYQLQARIEQMVHAVIHNKEISCALCGKKGSAVVLPPMGPAESRAELQRLAALALLGSSFPLPFFPVASEKYVEDSDMVAAAELYWTGLYGSGAPAESEIPACRISFRNMDPLAMGIPESPDISAGWKALWNVVSLPEADVLLFPGISELVFGFITRMKHQKEEAKSLNIAAEDSSTVEKKPKKAGSKKGGGA